MIPSQGTLFAQTAPLPPPPAPAAVEKSDVPIPVPTLVPRPQDRYISRYFTMILQRDHLQHPVVDDTVSKRAFGLYLESLDPFKLYFYQQDIDEFVKYENMFDDFAKAGDLSVPFMIYNRFLQRIDERVTVALKLIDMPHDFNVDEVMIQDKDTMTYAKSPEEAFDRWRKKIKYDILVLKEETRVKEKDRLKKKEEAEKNGTAEKRGAEEKKSKVDEKFDDPIDRLKRRYANIRKRMLLVNEKGNSLNDDVLETFLTAIGSALDPHSTYMSPSSYRNFIIQMRLKLEGIGATLTSVDGYTVVKRLVKGGPAQLSGVIKEEDKILAVGQGKEGPMEDVVDWRLTDVVDLIRGKKGTIVRLEILPDGGGERKIVEITRDEVKLEESEAKGVVFEDGKKADGTPYKIGVINLPSFYLDMDAARRGDVNAKSTTTDVKRILDNFNAQGVDAVILDLRYNGGGSLQEAVRLTGLFIETGNVVQTKDQEPNRPVQIRQLDDRDPTVEWTGPLVVLVNKFSASASEILAGAIKDYGRGLIVGDSRTHGKGSVQQMKDLAEESGMMGDASYGAMKLTIQGFYLPSGISPQTKGVKSDVVLPSFSDVLEDICEEDLHYPLQLEKIPPATSFPHFPYVVATVVQKLQQDSDARVHQEKEFGELARDIALYKEFKAKKTVTLNEKKYFEEQDRLAANRKERDDLEKVMDGENNIERDFYLNEVMRITIDYIEQALKAGVVFPKERSKAPKRSFLGDLFGT